MIDKFVHAAIVNPDELAALKSATEQAGLNLIYLDGTFVLPTSAEDIHKNHEDKRLPGALFFDIKSVADKNSSLPHMLPDADAFADAISALGIQNNDVIVVYGQHGMIMGPARVWWMFKGFGHENIIVLNGGLPAYEQADLELESGPHKTQPASVYNAKPFNTDMVVNMQDVLTTLKDCACPIVDARPANRYSGESPEPREGMRSGHMPGSLNTPASGLVDANGMLKSKEDLTAMMQKCGLIQNQQGTQRIITTCGSGITACALSLALYHLGQHNVAVYDGSWSEWGLESSPTPVKQAS